MGHASGCGGASQRTLHGDVSPFVGLLHLRVGHDGNCVCLLLILCEINSSDHSISAVGCNRAFDEIVKVCEKFKRKVKERARQTKSNQDPTSTTHR